MDFRMKSRNQPNLAIVGCGAIAERFFLPAFAKLSFASDNLILVDVDQRRVEELAKKYKVNRRLTDYHELFHTDIDGVIIATPHHLHYEIAIDFLSQGVHVLCEKPLAESANEAREMANVAKKAGVAIAVNNTRRLFPTYKKVKELISRGAIGELLSVSYHEGGEFDWPTASGFYFNPNSANPPKGVIMDRGAHVLDLICWWLGGKPELISSKNDSFGGGEAVAEIKFKLNKHVGEVRLSWLNKLRNSYIIEGREGAIEGSIYDLRNLYITSMSGRENKIHLKSDVNDFAGFGWKLIDNFINVVCDGATPLVSGADVVDSIQLLEECYKCATRFDLPWYKTVELPNVGK